MLKIRLVPIVLCIAMSLPIARADAGVDLGGVALAPDAERFVLDNGLEVVVIPDHRAPVVTHMLWYKAGAADEPPGKSGVAHYLEHLMYKGTKAHPNGYFSNRVAAIGGRENAFTSNDYTGYFQQVAKQHLREMMALEADRMRNLALTQEVAAPELNVVLEERRMRIENDPSAELGEAIDATLFVNSPYGDPIIGWPKEVASLTADDAIAFYRRHYAPQNALLVVAGDVTPDEVRVLAEETYGAIPRTGEPEPRVRTKTPKLRANRLVELADEQVNQESVRRAWVVPSYTTAGDSSDGYALDVLAEILGGSATSRLYRDLVRDGGPAASAGAWYQSSALDDTRFLAYAVPKDGVDIATLEEGITKTIADIAENGVDKAELERAKTSLVASAVFAQDNQSTMARIFGAALTTGSTVEDVQRWPQDIAAVTAADVRRVARTWLTPEGSVSGRLLKPAAEPKS